MRVYLIGSLRNPEVPRVAARLRELGHDVFDDWYAAGPEADDRWQAYETDYRKRSFAEALQGEAAKHVFNFDRRHLERADVVVLLMPAGKSGHMEFGWAVGRGARGIICMDREPERFDVMYGFAERVCVGVQALLRVLT